MEVGDGVWVGRGVGRVGTRCGFPLAPVASASVLGLCLQVLVGLNQ